MHLQPSHFLFGRQEGAFYRGQCVILPHILIIMINNDKNNEISDIWLTTELQC